MTLTCISEVRLKKRSWQWVKWWPVSYSSMHYYTFVWVREVVLFWTNDGKIQFFSTSLRVHCVTNITLQNMKSIKILSDMPNEHLNIMNMFKFARDCKVVCHFLVLWMCFVMSIVLCHWLFLHCRVNVSDLDRARLLCDKLCSSFPAHLMSSFSAYQLVQMVAINLFGLHHTRRKLDQAQWGGGRDEGENEGTEALSTDEDKVYAFILQLTRKYCTNMLFEKKLILTNTFWKSVVSTV